MSWRSLLSITIPLAAIAIVGLVVTAPTGGVDTKPDAAPEDAIDASEHIGQAGMRAYIDPETGQLETKATQAAPLPLDPATREALRRDSEGLVEIHHPDGSVSMNLQGRFQSATVARIGDDGRVTICSDDAQHLQSALEAAAAEQTPEVK